MTHANTPSGPKGWRSASATQHHAKGVHPAPGSWHRSRTQRRQLLQSRAAMAHGASELRLALAAGARRPPSGACCAENQGLPWPLLASLALCRDPQGPPAFTELKTSAAARRSRARAQARTVRKTSAAARQSFGLAMALTVQRTSAAARRSRARAQARIDSSTRPRCGGCQGRRGSRAARRSHGAQSARAAPRRSCATARRPARTRQYVAVLLRACVATALLELTELAKPVEMPCIC